MTSIHRAGDLARKLGPNVPSNAPALPVGPPFALRSDGVLLINVEHLQGIDLSGRPVWFGVELNSREAADVLERLDHAALEAAGSLGGQLIAAERKARTACDADEQGADESQHGRAKEPVHEVRGERQFTAVAQSGSAPPTADDDGNPEEVNP